MRNIRQSYLSTAPPRRTNTSRDGQSKHLTDRQKEEIDAETKQLLRELNASIRNLADAEQLRQNTETTLTRKKYGRLRLGALGSWAAGGMGHSKSVDQERDEAKSNTIKTHRENVLWYLRQKLQEAGSLQASMMEKRITREMEKNRSVLATARTGSMAAFTTFDDTPMPTTKSRANTAALEQQRTMQEEDLSPEQVQMFEKENQDMLKHYESTLDQVKCVSWFYARSELIYRQDC